MLQLNGYKRVQLHFVHFVHLFINFLYCIRCKRIFRALCLMGFSIGLELILCLTTEVRSKSMFRGSKQVLILKQEFFSLHSLCMRQIFFMVEEFEMFTTALSGGFSSKQPSSLPAKSPCIFTRQGLQHLSDVQAPSHCL